MVNWTDRDPIPTMGIQPEYRSRRVTLLERLSAQQRAHGPIAPDDYAGWTRLSCAMKTDTGGEVLCTGYVADDEGRIRALSAYYYKRPLMTFYISSWAQWHDWLREYGFAGAGGAR